MTSDFSHISSQSSFTGRRRCSIDTTKHSNVLRGFQKKSHQFKRHSLAHNNMQSNKLGRKHKNSAKTGTAKSDSADEGSMFDMFDWGNLPSQPSPVSSSGIRADLSALRTGPSPQRRQMTLLEQRSFREGTFKSEDAKLSSSSRQADHREPENKQGRTGTHHHRHHHHTHHEKKDDPEEHRLHRRKYNDGLDGERRHHHHHRHGEHVGKHAKNPANVSISERPLPKSKRSHRGERNKETLHKHPVPSLVVGAVSIGVSSTEEADTIPLLKQDEPVTRESGAEETLPGPVHIDEDGFIIPSEYISSKSKRTGMRIPYETYLRGKYICNLENGKSVRLRSNEGAEVKIRARAKNAKDIVGVVVFGIDKQSALKVFSTSDRAAVQSRSKRQT